MQVGWRTSRCLVRQEKVESLRNSHALFDHYSVRLAYVSVGFDGHRGYAVPLPINKVKSLVIRPTIASAAKLLYRTASVITTQTGDR